MSPTNPDDSLCIPYRNTIALVIQNFSMYCSLKHVSNNLRFRFYEIYFFNKHNHLEVSFSKLSDSN